MKLANHLSIRILRPFLLVLFCWSVVYFLLQMKEVYDGIEEGVTNLKQEFIVQANSVQGFAEMVEQNGMLNIKVEEVTFEEVKNFPEEFITTKVYFPTEEEEEEVRMLVTAFRCEMNNHYYRLKIFTSTVESNDLIKNMLYLLLVLWGGLGLTFFITSRRAVMKASAPFYRLLEALKEFRLDRNRMIDFPETSITEYAELNRSVKQLLEQNLRTFSEQKNFIENISHELQTPLAIVIGKLEILLSKTELNRHQMEEVHSVLKDLNRMKRLNNSLLLLFKVRNEQFSKSQVLDLSGMLLERLDMFRDLIEHKGLRLEIEDEGHCVLEINPDLAYILVTNLLKNAVTHNIKDGSIGVRLTSESIILSNDGLPSASGFDVFERYRTSGDSNQSLGLGLSIVKSIVDIYNLEITYRYEGRHTIELKIKDKRIGN